jgi:hypothetical protein
MRASCAGVKRIPQLAARGRSCARSSSPTWPGFVAFVGADAGPGTAEEVGSLDAAAAAAIVGALALALIALCMALERAEQRPEPVRLIGWL